MPGALPLFGERLPDDRSDRIGDEAEPSRWVAQHEREEESVVGPSVIFVPMTRLEKILLDRSSGDLPSLAERFQRRIGRSVQQVLDGGG